jgi:ubiquinone/menaquinone biosynthesis C-methylase UbiE
MNHHDHVRLLQDGIAGPGGVWADFGSGTGAFTLALADLIGASGEIYSLDKDAGALRRQEQVMHASFPDVSVHYVRADFTQPLDLPALDGIVIANALHFHRHKEAIVRRLYEYLRSAGRLIVVEYNVDRGNLWVPHPISYQTWEAEARKGGFRKTRLLATVPSRFLHEMYSALSEK